MVRPKISKHYNLQILQGGESSVSGSSGFKFSGTKSYEIPTAVIKETEVSVVPIEQKHEHKVHTEFKLDTANEITHSEPNVDVKVNAQPVVIVKEVSYPA